jgi:hypothetical protein
MMTGNALRRAAPLLAGAALAACGAPPAPTQDGSVCTANSETISILSVQHEGASVLSEESSGSPRAETEGNETLVIQFEISSSEREQIVFDATLFLEDGSKGDVSSFVFPDFKENFADISRSPPHDMEFTIDFSVPVGETPDVFRLGSCVFDIAQRRDDQMTSEPIRIPAVLAA